ncbi:DUF4249 family protein [Persicobacter diffluens]|uniref:DUF4249 domain-containing protein n=1 Tax=Persicobacter diffluens TaxID=981 RepID=A0AAN4W0H8_9BACT|nr:hypothetical protein PEDI_36800 [Persicobacter diffluens]
MKKIILLKLLAVVILLTSCEKDIKLDLNYKKMPVVEANVREGQAPLVKVSWTSPYYEAGKREYISDLEIRLSDDGGKEVLLNEDSIGHYSHADFEGQVGRLYQISFDLVGKSFQASSYLYPPSEQTVFEYFYKPIDLPDHVPDSVKFGDYQGIVYYMIDADANARIHPYNNHELEEGFYLSKENGIPLYGIYFEGDTATIVVETIDRAMYQYYKNLSDLSGASNIGVPANPSSNWNRSDILGYFAATATDTVETIIQAKL